MPPNTSVALGDNAPIRITLLPTDDVPADFTDDEYEQEADPVGRSRRVWLFCTAMALCLCLAVARAKHVVTTTKIASTASTTADLLPDLAGSCHVTRKRYQRDAVLSSHW